MNISFKSSVEGFVFYSFAPDKREKSPTFKGDTPKNVLVRCSLYDWKYSKISDEVSMLFILLLLALVDNHGGESLCGFLQQLTQNSVSKLHNILWSKITLISEVAAAAVHLKSSIPLSLSC